MAFRTGDDHDRIAASSSRPTRSRPARHTRSSCPDLIRASILLRKSLAGKDFAKGMDCRVKPGNDELLSVMTSCWLITKNTEVHHVHAASDWSRPVSKGDPARLHRAAAGVLQRARRNRASDLEAHRAGRQR